LLQTPDWADAAAWGNAGQTARTAGFVLAAISMQWCAPLRRQQAGKLDRCACAAKTEANKGRPSTSTNAMDRKRRK
jgi:hypothetical protein